MTSQRQGPIFVARIWAIPRIPFHLITWAIILWAWASWGLICGRSSARARRVTTGPNNCSSLCGWVPMGHGWATLPAQGLTPHLSFRGLGRSHIAWDTVEARMLSCRVPTGAIPIDIFGVHFNGLLRGVIGGCHIGGLHWTQVTDGIWLWWHPMLEPIPSPPCLFTLVGVKSDFIKGWIWR